MKKVVFSGHAIMRMKEKRQYGITKDDVINWAQKLPGRITHLSFKCFAESGRCFEIVVSDKDDIRTIITIIGIE